MVSFVYIINFQSMLDDMVDILLCTVLYCICVPNKDILEGILNTTFPKLDNNVEVQMSEVP